MYIFMILRVLKCQRKFVASCNIIFDFKIFQRIRAHKTAITSNRKTILIEFYRDNFRSMCYFINITVFFFDLYDKQKKTYDEVQFNKNYC